MTQLPLADDPTTAASATELFELFLASKEVENCRPTTLRDYRTERFRRTPGVPPSPALWRSDHRIIWLAQLRRENLADSTVAYHQRHLYVRLWWLFEHGDIATDIRRRVKRVRFVESPWAHRYRGPAGANARRRRRRTEDTPGQPARD